MKLLEKSQIQRLINSSPLLLAKFATGGRYLCPPHLVYLDKKLRQVGKGEIKRLIVSVPPRHGKSEMISKYFPVWWLCNFPSHRIMLTSYQSTLSADWSRKSRDIFEQLSNDYLGYKLAFGARRNDKWDIDKFQGGIEATGIRGGQTGKGANVLIIDDPVKNDEEAFSQTYRDKNYDWFQSTAFTRLEPGGAIILIMTRWHYDDLAGRILRESKEEWEVINFPALATEDDVLGRKPGDALWEKRFSKENLETIKNEIGSYWFSALYQQNPMNSKHQIYKESWWLRYDTAPNGGDVIQSWDTAFKDKEKNDYSVCTTWSAHDKKAFLLDLVREKMEFPELLRKVITLAERYNPKLILIEDKASGQSLIQTLKRETRLPIKAVQADRDKVVRAHLATPMIEAGKVYIPNNAPWIKILISETSEFPYSAHDDIVDSINQALMYLHKLTSSSQFYNPITKITKHNYYRGF